MRYFLILIITFYFGCSKSEKSDRTKLDSQKTIELIEQVLKDKNHSYLSPSCILEHSMFDSNFEFSDFGNKINEHLRIQDSTHYKLQEKTFNDFRITKIIVPNKKIITEKKYRDFKSNREFWKWLESNYKGGFCRILKPVFNENYNLAYIQVSRKTMEFDYSSEILIYEYKNGIWKEKTVISRMIS